LFFGGTASNNGGPIEHAKYPDEFSEDPDLTLASEDELFDDEDGFDEFDDDDEYDEIDEDDERRQRF
jgi:hypothetical protein